MPELPEVETVCRTLAPYLDGRTFMSFELRWPRTLGNIEPSTFARSVSGRSIESVSRRAKFIVIGLDDGSAITVHLRMTGQLLWIPADADRQPDTFLRAEFLLDDGSVLLFSDIRKFGRIQHLGPDEFLGFSSLLGIEPLSDEFTAGWLRTHLANRKRQMKPLLLDQTFVAGLGNIYVDESLHAAGIHPLSLSNLTTRPQSVRLHSAIVDILSGAIERQGTTLRNYRSGTGEPGTNQSTLNVYGSPDGTPCPRCGKGLKRIVVGQRGTVFCPRCQRLKRTPRR